jgi:hypothetical protein
MSASNHPADPKKLPVPFKPPSGSRDIEHQASEWASGSRGGGSVPADVNWHTNPKQHQEERGAGDADQVLSK